MNKLPEGRKPIDDSWMVKKAYSLEEEIKQMVSSRDFPKNTCPASRHVQIMAEELATIGKYPMLEEDPGHCAGSLATVVSSLYQARSFLSSLGYTWAVNGDGIVEWKKNE
jgi:hypothetical protein